MTRQAELLLAKQERSELPISLDELPALNPIKTAVAGISTAARACRSPMGIESSSQMVLVCKKPWPPPAWPGDGCRAGPQDTGLHLHLHRLLTRFTVTSSAYPAVGWGPLPMLLLPKDAQDN